MLIKLVFLLLVSLLAAGINPYEVLGIDSSADEKTIKTAYRQLSKQYHPDKSSSPDAHDKFIEISEAYEILSDPEKKQNYDRFGDPEGMGAMGGMGGMGGFGDPFGQFQRQYGRPGKPRGGDTNVELNIPLKDFFLGRDMDFGVNMNNICDTCTGTGSADGKYKKCSKCNGLGVILTRRQLGPFISQYQSPCDTCRGTGTVIENLCKVCHGSRVSEQTRNYNIFCAPGTPRNYVQTMEGEGHQSPDWIPGNLNFRFKEKSEDNWGYRRIGHNLYRTEVLLAKEALLGGWERKIATFDDDFVEIKRKKGQAVKDGAVDIFKGRGMPVFNDDSHGTLFVEYRVLPSRKHSLEKDEL